MNSSNFDNRRRFFRLAFPPGEELATWIEGSEYLVNEISERTLRFTKAYIPNKRGICRGILQWSNGNIVFFRGLTGPLNGNFRVIIDVLGIEMQDVIREQRRLLAKYPTIKEDSRE